MGGTQSFQPATFRTNLMTGLFLPRMTVYAAEKDADIVIIPVDESDQAEQAFEWYLNHMHQDGNTVRILYCQEFEHAVKDSFPVYPMKQAAKKAHPSLAANEAFEEEIEKERQGGMKLMEKYSQKLEKAGVKGTFHTSIGKPGEVIVNAIMEHKGTMIVMGTRGLGMVRRTILGSVSEYCSVLGVKSFSALKLLTFVMLKYLTVPGVS